MEENVHKNMALADKLRLIGELQHMRSHCILAAASEPELSVPYLVLAKRCQSARRDFQKKYFPNTKEKDWCIIKSAGQLLQLLEETADGDAEEMSELKSLVDNAIMITTGEDISGCSACRDDKK